MEFLVHIKVCYPPDGDAGQREHLVRAEAVRAAELAEEGRIRRLWRVPGQWANYGIWEAPDATELHAAISSLPFFPWLDVDVTALSAHPSDPATRNAETES